MKIAPRKQSLIAEVHKVPPQICTSWMSVPKKAFGWRDAEPTCEAAAPGMHTGAAARMAASPLASDIAAGAEAFGAAAGSLQTPSATSLSAAEQSAAQPAGQGSTADGAAGASAGRGTPQQGLGPALLAASQSSIAGAPSNAAVQEGSGTKAAG